MVAHAEVLDALAGEKNNSPSLLADFYTYWQGAPNASPSVLVPLADRVIEVLTWDGTRFAPFDLVANNILAAGTVAAKHLAVDSVTAEKVKTNAITVDKLAANSVTTEKLVSDAVTAAKLAADSVQARNIVSLAITTDKLAANSVTTAKLRVTEDMTVALLNVHKIQAGDIVSGAVTADKIAANAVNADKIAANSVNASKIVSGAITADKLAANSVTAVKIAAGTITTDKVAAGQFRGYVFTGAIFQSSDAENTGVKLNSTGLRMWDSNHNQTVLLDGEGKSNLLTGTFQTSLTGRRIRISPTFQQSLINSDDKTEGSGIEFMHGRDGRDAYIASESRTKSKGEVSTIVINGGRMRDTDPGSFMRLGECKAVDNATKIGEASPVHLQGLFQRHPGRLRATALMGRPDGQIPYIRRTLGGRPERQCRRTGGHQLRVSVPRRVPRPAQRGAWNVRDFPSSWRSGQRWRGGNADVHVWFPGQIRLIPCACLRRRLGAGHGRLECRFGERLRPVGAWRRQRRQNPHTAIRYSPSCPDGRRFRGSEHLR